jgi:hypothetical protein
MSAPLRLYLAGKMSGVKDLNFPRFHAEASRLRALGYDIVNPAEINGGADELTACTAMTTTQMTTHWSKCMRNDIRELMTCDGIATIPGYETSKGANLEVFIARELRMPVWNAEDLVVPV